jgi:hypothetical protein
VQSVFSAILNGFIEPLTVLKGSHHETFVKNNYNYGSRVLLLQRHYWEERGN